MNTFILKMPGLSVLLNAKHKHAAVELIQTTTTIADKVKISDLHQVEYKKSNRALIWGVVDGQLQHSAPLNRLVSQHIVSMYKPT